MTDKIALIALDQGTTSTRAIAFAPDGGTLADHQQELTQYYPQPGWVEHDGAEIFQAAVACLKSVLAQLKQRHVQPLACGITNQRETSLVWDRQTGEPIHRAIVWQDRRTADVCRALKNQGHETEIGSKTGLLLDPYFSASKIAWILDHVEGARERAVRGELAFGTVESYLLARLCDVHVSDVTNAARTSLMDIHRLRWDEDLCDLFNVPTAILPDIRPNAGPLGVIPAALVGQDLPVTGAAGDQQSAAIGQLCLAPGDLKSTYGTGCFVLQNVGDRAVQSSHRLLSTVAFQIGDRTDYALEGSIFVAGAAIQWLRDGLGILEHASDSATLAASLSDNDGVYLVPAFTGLGAPHWAPEARAMITGMSRGTGPAHLARAALESVAYQTADLMRAFTADAGIAPPMVKIDGGMAANDWFAQFLTDILGIEVQRPRETETTALGAAMLAGLGAGYFTDLSDLEQLWQEDRRFEPSMDPSASDRLQAGWRDALARCLMTGNSG